MKRHIITALLLLVAGAMQARDIEIIPAPQSVTVMEGNYRLRDLRVYTEAGDREADLLEMVAARLQPATGMHVTRTGSKKAGIRFVSDPDMAEDAYSLTIDRHGVTIGAASYGGHFYGLQTLTQLLPKEIKSTETVYGMDWELPYIRIEDAPRFPWRGMMLDVSRHWFTKEEVMRYIDEISEYKFNIFHWHLTDDQGWRIQIDSCPELTSKGCMRATRVGKWWKRDAPDEGEALDYGGFYTKDDVREVLAYAAMRNVSVMPEIDVPGHSTAMLVAFPELACFKAPKYVNVGNTFYTIDENALCPGKDRTFEVMDSILREIAELFPFEYVHIGGDECYHGFWGKCPDCARRMKEEGIGSLAELQSYFIKRMEKILSGYGKKIMGWDEITEGGLADNAAVMSWRGMERGKEAAKAGHPVVMTPMGNCYLDFYQGEKTAEPETYSMLRVSSCYDFEPVPEGVDPACILGGQGNLWTESVPVFRHAEYMAWPRGWALAEVLWSPAEARDWNDFTRRMETHFLRAQCADINCSDKSVYNAVVTPALDPDKGLTITLGKEIEDIELRYTFDGTNPDHHSPVYSNPLTVPRNADCLKVQSYRNGAKAGNMLTIKVEDLTKRAAKK